MWRDAGLLRSEATLQRAAEQVEQWSQHARAARPAGASHTQLGDALLIANLIIRSALWRCESRGCHRRSDFPAPDPRFLVHDIWRQNLAAPRLEPVHDPARRATHGAEPIRSIA